MNATDLELRAGRMRRKRADIRRLQGIPNQTEGAPVAAHLHTLISTGWTRLQIAAASGVSDRAIRYILNGQREVQLATAQALLAVQPHKGLARVDATGTIRRIQALAVTGWPIGWTANQAERTPSHLHRILNGSVPLAPRCTAERIALIYQAHEATQGPSQPSRAAAAHRGWVPPIAWDDDTIDDPSATPDWTGFCGTDRGYWTHTLRKLPMCPPCGAAHRQWCDERAGVDPVKRNQLMFAARAAAGTRGADIAHDGRELMRVSGLDSTQAAARLGVTRNHLQQELLRHPAPADEMTAA